MNLRKFENGNTLSLALGVICLYLIFAASWQLGLTPLNYDNARYSELLVLGLVLLQLVHPRIADATAVAWFALGKDARILILFILGAGAVSVAASGAIHLGLLELALMVQLIVLSLLVSAAIREDRRRVEAALALALFAGTALFVLKFWVNYVLYAFEGKEFPWDSPFIEFANVRFFSQYQAYTLLAASLPLTLFDLKKWQRALIFILCANFWALHWMVGTRAAWVGLIVATIVVLACLREGRMRWLLSQLKLVLTGAAIFAAHHLIVAQIASVEQAPGIRSIVDRGQGSINERLALAKSAWVFVREHPLLGVGPGQFGLQWYAAPASHPHNVPLQLLSEYGIAGGLAGIALIGLLVFLAVKTLRNGAVLGNDQIGPAVVGALLMGLTDSLFSGNLVMPHGGMFFAILAGWIVGRGMAAPVDVKRETVAWRRMRLAIAGTAVLAVAISSILALEYLIVVWQIPASMTGWNPHFWQYGHFADW
jgi:O-antigen ligase